jgi:hypothetical protein
MQRCIDPHLVVAELLKNHCKKCRGMKDYYRILDLPADASSEAVKARYRLLVRIFHPDRYPQPEDKAYAEQRLQEINEAYETIQGKRARGLALSTDTRPPRPMVDPPQVDFGKVVRGDRVHAQIQVDNAGGLAQGLNFRCEDDVEWVAVVNGKRLDPDRPLPLVLTLEAATESLDIDRAYESWLTVDMNGVTARVPLALQVVDHPAPGRGVGWLLSAVVALLLTVLLYFGWQWADSGLMPATTAALGTVETPLPAAASLSGVVEAVESPPVQVSSAQMSHNSDETGDDAFMPASTGAEPDLVAHAIITETQTATPMPSVIGNSFVAPTNVLLRESSEPPTGTPTSTPAHTATPTPSPMPTLTATEQPRTPTATPTRDFLPAETTETPTPSLAVGPQQAPNSAIVLTVPQTFDVNARADTSVESDVLALLLKGTTYRGVARTIDNAWTQIILADGRTAWVFTETMEADIEQIALLPVSLALLDVSAIAERPSLDVVVDSAGGANGGDGDEFPSPSPATARITVQQIHLVQPGEYLKQLARSYYGDEALWERIYEANRQIIGPDPNQLEAGIELVIPAE